MDMRVIEVTDFKSEVRFDLRGRLEVAMGRQPRLQQLRNGGEDYSIKKCSGKAALLSFRSKKWLRESVNTPRSRWYRIHQGYIHRQS